MKVKPIKTHDPFAELTPLQQKTRKIAIAIAFIGVFVWAVKILFL